MACLQARYGWCRWVVTFAAFIEIFLALGLLYSYSILFVSLQKEFHSSSANTGWLGSLASALATLISPLTGLLEQRFHNRNLVLVGVALFCAGLLATSFVPVLEYAYLTFGVAVGVGANLMTHPSIALLLDWFAKRNFARSSSIALLGSTSGMLAFGYLLTTIITQYSWRVALRILSGGIFVVGTADSLLLTKPLVGKDATRQSTEATPDRKHEMEDVVVRREEGNEEDAEEETTFQESQLNEPEDTTSNMKNADINHSRSSHNSKGKLVHIYEMLAAMKDLEPWLFSAGGMLSFLGWTFFNINFASFMEGLDLNSTQIASGIVLFAGGELGGKILIAFVGDQLPFTYLYVVIMSCVAGTVTLGLLTVAKTYLMVALLAVASGFMRSGVYGAIFVTTKQLFDEVYGTNGLMALTLVPQGVGILVSAPLSGGLYDVTGDYVLSLVIIAALFLCASAAFLFIPLWRRIRSCHLCCSSETQHADDD